MGYKKALEIFPLDILEQIQNYVEGETIYIPKRNENKKSWGEGTDTRKVLYERNTKIYEEYMQGISVDVLSEKYFLAEKSIRRIISQQKYMQTIQRV